MEKYWFYIESFVIVNRKDNMVLFYNPFNEFYYISSDDKILEMYTKLVEVDKMRVLELSDDDLNNKVVKDFISVIRDSYSGDILTSKYSNIKPIQFIPEVRVFIPDKYSKSNALGSNVLDNVKYISLYINDTCNLHCENCFSMCKQFVFCSCSNSKSELRFDTIVELLSKSNLLCLEELNLFGGNIFEYSLFDLLIKYVSTLPYSVNIHTHFENIDLKYLKKEYIKIIGSNINFRILVTSDVKIMDIKRLISGFATVKFDFCFVIETLNRFEEINKLSQEMIDIRFFYTPFYNGNNMDFFVSDVFFSKVELLASVQSFEEVLRRKIINTNDFGKIVICNNGEIYTNLNLPSIGNIYNDNLKNVLYKELSSGISWTKTRKLLPVCKDCICNIICPSVSNYEYVFNRYDLCGLKL